MKRTLLIILIIASIAMRQAQGQAAGHAVPSTLEQLFIRMRNAAGDSTRLSINDSIKLIVGEYVATGRSFSGVMPGPRYLGRIASSDSAIKIVTWNLALRDQPGRYFCYIIRKSARGIPDKIYSLEREYEEKDILSDTTYSGSDWYGALYYDIRSFRTAIGRQWIVLGINYSNPSMTRKIIDVLSFTGDDRMILGAKIFDEKGAMHYRHVLEYSAGAIISLRFLSDNAIVFDHLVPLPPSGGDIRITYGPDYSYDEFLLKKGLWHLQTNVDVRNKRK